MQKPLVRAAVAARMVLLQPAFLHATRRLTIVEVYPEPGQLD
jgi:hypothetical protein